MVPPVPADVGQDRIGVGRASLMSEGEKPDPLARLAAEIDRARAAQPASKVDGPRGPNLQQGMGLGFRIGIEFVVAIVVATGLGWAIDRWLGTRPWGMIVMFFLGVGAGMVNVYRAVAGIKTAVGYGRSGDAPAAKKGAWDDEE